MHPNYRKPTPAPVETVRKPPSRPTPKSTVRPRSGLTRGEIRQIVMDLIG